MDRRKFLKSGTVAGVAAASIAIGSCNSPENNQKTVENPSSGVPDFELDEITIAGLQTRMKSGELTSRAITEMYLKRINEVDKNGPALNSVIELNPDALAIADSMDAERKSGKLRGPLHGIPVLIKDNIDTADKMMTTAGSLALEGHHAKADAFVVKQLREAGSVLLGKTNLSEWANFRSLKSTSGWSSRGGQTKNPCMLNRNPCGSSSGSGVAVAANLCAVAVGTETDGSVIAPASYNGIVGIKPTVGLVSRTGIIPISKTQDTAGPMARTVSDAAILLSVMTGQDGSDPVTAESDGRTARDYTTFLDINGLHGKKIGIERSFLKGNKGVVGLYKQAIELMKSKGAEIIEVDLLDKTEDLDESEFVVLMYEFKDGLNKYLSGVSTGVKTLADLIEFNKKNADRVMPYFAQETLELSQSQGGLDDKGYKEALQKILGTRKIITDLILQHQLDAIASTSIGPANCTDLVNGDYMTGFYFCPPAAMAGYPHITVPMGTVHELPVGLSFISGPYTEAELLKIAFAYEQASKKRMKPKFIQQG
jgi:amidase